VDDLLGRIAAKIPASSDEKTGSHLSGVMRDTDPVNVKDMASALEKEIR